MGAKPMMTRNESAVLGVWSTGNFVRRLVMLVSTCICVSLTGCDISPVDDSTLRLAPPSAVEHAAFVELNSLAKTISWPEGEDAGSPSDPSWQGGRLGENADVLDQLNRLLVGPSFRLPTPNAELDDSWSVQSWRHFSELQLFAANELLAAGRAEEAAAQALLAIELASRTQSAGGGLMGFIVGRSIEARANDWIRSNARYLADFASKLIDRGSSSRALADAYRSEYVVIAELFEDPTKMQEDGGPLTIYTFHPERTKAEYMRSTNGIIEQIRKPCPERDLAVAREMHFVDYLLPNVAGRILQNISFSGLLSAGYYDCELSVDRGATDLVVALVSFETDRGKLPESLDALIPTYLETLPEDPFSPGQAFRYSPAQRLIYSVGENLVDDGGELGQRVWAMPDASFEIPLSR